MVRREVVSGSPALSHVLNELARSIVQEWRKFLVVLAVCRRKLNVQLDVPDNDRSEANKRHHSSHAAICV